MTPQEISEKYVEAARKFRRIRSVRIGMGNYQEVMTAYQDILWEVIHAGHELSKAVAALSSPVKEANVESATKEK